MQEEEYLTIKDIAQQLKLDEKTIRRWIKSKQLPAIELGGKYRVTRSDLNAFLESRKLGRQG
jgi:excisionase family DNA binding protein